MWSSSAAAGNDASATPTYPAGLAKVVGVGSTDQADAAASFSNTSGAVFVTAPGTDIAASDASGITSISGTSASAAIVAGAAALLKAEDTSASPATIVGRIARNADPNTGIGGNGRINLARAVGDSSTDGVTPAGVPGGGGPVVGPYVAAGSRRHVLGGAEPEPGPAGQYCDVHRAAWTVSAASLAEGNSGTSTMNFTIHLNVTSGSQAANVHYATSGGTANRGHLLHGKHRLHHDERGYGGTDHNGRCHGQRDDLWRHDARAR